MNTSPDEQTPQSSPSQSSTSQTVPKRFFSRKVIRIILLFCACLIALGVLAYIEEDVRGRIAWKHYKQEREAKGDSFELKSIVPAPVPDEENFAALPMFKELFQKSSTNPQLSIIKMPIGERLPGNWHIGKVEDLAEWRKIFENDNLIDALAQYSAILDEVTKASRRPHCVFPIRYEDNFNALLPHLQPLRNLTRVYRLRALAELEAGQNEAAAEDVLTSLRIIQHLKNEPLLITFLVRAAMLDETIQPIWEGISAHRWNNLQLVRFQEELKKIDQFYGFSLALRGERILSHHTIWMSEHRSRIDFLIDFFSPMCKDCNNFSLEPYIFYLFPKGWFCQNALTLDRFYIETFLPAVDWEHHCVSPSKIEAVHQALRVKMSPYNIFMRLMMPRSVSATEPAMSQTSADEAVLACTLERYRMAQGDYPPTLDALVPTFVTSLPPDRINCQPLKYRRTNDGKFVLYSVGWNEKDDGGVVATRKSGSQDYWNGDWVWAFPSK